LAGAPVAVAGHDRRVRGKSPTAARKAIERLLARVDVEDLERNPFTLLELSDDIPPCARSRSAPS